jgi:putative phosphoribosyl transferase
MTAMFADRADSGRRLAEKLRYLAGEDTVVLGLPRGGVPVAFEVAAALEAPLDVLVVRKLGVPYQPELAMGAVGEGGVLVFSEEVVRISGVSQSEITALVRSKRAEVDRLAVFFRDGREPASLTGRTVVLVDDGIATGATARAACQVARAKGATRVVVGVPVAAPSSLADIAEVADEVACLEAPRSFFAVGQFYRDFSQTTDEEVVSLLRQAAEREARAGQVADPLIRDEEVEVPAGTARLIGNFRVPAPCSGLVVFAHGSGSSRHSPRNRSVAAALNTAGLGTLLVDLLASDEEVDRSQVFDIELLAARLEHATGWVEAQPESKGKPVGYFGASTGAAAALWAAAEPASGVAAIVSRGGRPDLAGPRLAEVRAPTLLIVGGNDDVVLELNRQTQAHLRCPTELAVVPGATHLFEEPGALREVTRLALRWFLRHLEAPGSPAER